MKKTLKKLVLSRETLQNLDSSTLENVAGGKPPITITECLDTNCGPASQDC